MRLADQHETQPTIASLVNPMTRGVADLVATDAWPVKTLTVRPRYGIARIEQPGIDDGSGSSTETRRSDSGHAG